MNPKLSLTEYEDSNNELRELLFLAEKAERDLLLDDEGKKRQAIRILCWTDFDGIKSIESDEIDTSLIHRMWLIALNYLGSYLRFAKNNKTITRAPNFRHLFNTYEKIRHPNCMIILQPRLEVFNTIEAQ